MIILGISNTKDSGACLIKNGKLVAAVNEERFNREKLTRKFPENSINWILKKHKLTSNDIDAISFGSWKGIETNFLPQYVSNALTLSKNNPNSKQRIIGRLEGSARSDSKQKIELENGLKKLNLEKIPQYYTPHHLAHAYTAFAFSSFPHALVIILDGRGDFQSGLVTAWKNGKAPNILRYESELDSLGAFYGWITNYLGFTPDRHEGKITGLSARGDPRKCLPILKKMISTKNGKIIGNVGDYYAPYMKAKLPNLEQKLKKYSREDIAAATQFLTEEIVVNYAKYYLKKTKENYLCLAGGIFANVLVNMRLRELKQVKQLFVFPHMGDGGISVGSASYVSDIFKEKIKSIEHVYLGPSFSQKECLTEIKKHNVKIEKPLGFSRKIAKLLNEGKVVGLFCGAMEFGPRALGRRSILVRATDPTINISLNKRLFRTEFMPFAPVTLEEYAKQSYKDWNRNDQTSYYMTSCYKASNELRKLSPAVVHIDGTARPQIVTKSINSELYQILKEYHKLTAIPSLINTSFNLHEEPIVRTPKEAISLLIKDGIDVLAMPPFIIYRK